MSEQNVRKPDKRGQPRCSLCGHFAKRLFNVTISRDRGLQPVCWSCIPDRGLQPVYWSCTPDD